METFKKILSICFGLSLLIGLVLLIAWSLKSFFALITSLPKEVAAALIAGAATVIVATMTVMIGRHYERKKELDALYRDKKTEIYDEFLREFFDQFFGNNEKNADQVEKNLVPFLREFTRKLVLWSGPEVLESFIEWKEHLAKGTPDAKSIFLTEKFLSAIRTDLRHTNKGLRKGFFARLFLREGPLFLAMAEKTQI